MLDLVGEEARPGRVMDRGQAPANSVTPDDPEHIEAAQGVERSDPP
jgi:hypothetical protein